jgi:hypothetical protein
MSINPVQFAHGVCDDFFGRSNLGRTNLRHP